MNFILRYFRFPDSNTLVATIIPNNPNDIVENLIASYFTDNGGMSLTSQIIFLKSSIGKLEDLSINKFDISSNSYGAEIVNNNVRLYFLYDESQESLVDRFRFLNILKLWVVFLERFPIENYKEFIDF